MPKVSVIVPIYNVAAYLPKCLDSLTGQTLEDIEIILASDGPQDCHDICDAYAVRDARISVIKDYGSYGASVNAALKIAKGEYIGLVESDDWCAPEMFERLYRKAVETGADVVKAGFYSVVGKKMKKSSVPATVNQVVCVEECPELVRVVPSIWSAVYKRDFLLKNEIFFMEKRLSFIDTPFYLETLFKAERFVFLKDYLYFYNCNNDNQSVKSEAKVLDGVIADEFVYERLKKLKKFSKLKNVFYASVFSRLLWNYGRIAEKYLDEFWGAAQDYVGLWKDDCDDFSFFSPREKEMFDALSKGQSRRNYEYSRKKVKRIKLFSGITLLRAVTEKGKISYYLFKKFLIFRRKVKI